VTDNVASDERDEALVRRALAGDAPAYASLVRRYRRAALARALAIVLDAFDADDVAQEAFVQAYEQLATLRDPARFGAWLLTIVHRRSLNALRASTRRRTTALSDSLPDHSASAGIDASSDAPSRPALLAALASLSPTQRTVVLLADLEDLPHEKIARAVGCSVTMSRRHLSDGRRRLRELLTQEKRR
jgi:RNA polymerase sigma-70 factor (ECF subfamily)